ncbi:CHAT domain-containing protein [Actinophytocola sp. KF-1]
MTVLGPAEEPSPESADIHSLRQLLVRAEPGSDDEAGIRLRLADHLIDRFESAAGERDVADLDEAIYHATWVLGDVRPMTQTWFDARFAQLWARMDRWDALSERADLDHAIELAEELATMVGSAFLELTHGEFRVQRYEQTDDAEDLAEAERAFLRALDADPTTEQYHQAKARLGLIALDRVRAGYRVTTTVHDLAEPISVLQASIGQLPPSLPVRNLVLYRLGEAHTLRYVSKEFAEAGGDPAAELTEAIDYLRDVRHAGIRSPEVDYELVQALVMYHDERPDPADREDAITLLHELADEMDTAGLGDEHAELLGQLYLARAVTDDSPDELCTTIRFLERTADGAGAVSETITSLLLEAYGRCKLASSTERARERRMVARMLDDEAAAAAMGVRSGLGALHALETMAPAALDEAGARIRADIGSGRADDDLVVSTTLLGLLAVARYVGDLVPAALRPTRLLFELDDDLGADLVDWLERYRDRVPGPGAVCHLLAVAVLRMRTVGDIDAPPVPGDEPVQLAVVGDLERVLAAPDCDDLALVAATLLGAQHLALLRRRGHPEHARRATELLEGVLAGAAAERPIRTDAALSFSLTVVLAKVLGFATSRHEAAAEALTRLAADRDLPSDRRAVFRYVLSLLKTLSWLDGSPDPDLAGPVEDCMAAVALLPPGYPGRDFFTFGTALILADRFLLTGDLADLDTAAAYLDSLPANGEIAGHDVDEARMRIGFLRWQSTRDGDATTALADHLRAQIRRQAALPTVPENAGTLAMTHCLLAQVLIAQLALSDDQRLLDEAADHASSALRLLPGNSPLRGRVELTSAIPQVALAVSRRDRGLFLATVRRLDDVPVLEGSHPLTLDRATHHLGMAIVWLTWAVGTDDAAALDNAFDWFRRGTAPDAGPPGHIGAAVADLHQAFADAAWRRGHARDVPFALATGMAALHTLLWRVLGQSSTELSLEQASEAADRALAIAVRCLVVGELGTAVEALEGGRGLVLRAGAAAVGFGALLRREGFTELATEWEQAGGDDAPDHAQPSASAARPDALRHRVLRTLRSTPSARELTGTLDTGAIAAALRGLDMDVLAYLVPARGANFGRALLVHAGGELDQILLPGLRADGHGQVTDYVTARRAVDAHPTMPAALAAWHRELDSVGTWAWRHAVGPLRDRLSGLGRPPRVVLVPCGELGVVPWHAARQNLLSGPRYALEDMVLSYAGSARQLVELSRRPRRVPGERPVVIANPTGDLLSARVETRFLAGLYPSARLFGLVDDDLPVLGRGTRDEVLDELATASLLHFGCHAEGRATPAASMLRLADGQVLTVDRLLRRGHRGGGATGATVVLAACQSDLTEDVHDEALTLSNAFVAVGATSVIGTRWAVNDLASSALMCQFHLVLRTPGTRPLDALRAAQLWMLDPARSLPPDLPAAVVEHLAGIDMTAPALWAGFVHCGW